MIGGIADRDPAAERMTDQDHILQAELTDEAFKMLFIIRHAPGFRRIVRFTETGKVDADNMKSVLEVIKDRLHHFLVLSPAVQQHHIPAASFFQVGCADTVDICKFCHIAVHFT